MKSILEVGVDKPGGPASEVTAAALTCAPMATCMRSKDIGGLSRQARRVWGTHETRSK